MILNYKKFGQLGNRLFYIAHLVAVSHETGHQLIDFSLDGYNHFFEDWNGYNAFTYPRNFAVLKNKKLNAYALRAVQKVEYELQKRGGTTAWGELLYPDRYINEGRDIQAYFNHYKQNKVFVCQDWVWKEYLDLGKYKHLVKPLFKPAEPYATNIKKLVANLRSKAEVLVGIHIRRSDYKQYKGGIYYFEDDVYKRFIADAANLFPDKKVLFVICSDEKINTEVFLPYSTVYAGGSIIEDLYTLAECDYLLGPPSTFSGWASYINDVPLLSLTHRDAPIGLDKFRICNDRLLHLTKQ